MWFKVWDWQKRFFDEVSDEEAGAGIKAALRLLTGEPVGVLSDGALKVYRRLERGVLIAREIDRARKESDNAEPV